MKFLIIGTGSIGTRHLQNLKSLGHSVFVYDFNLARLEEVCSTFGAESYDPLSHIVHFDAWLICTPPYAHVPWANEAIKHGSHVFIEKPISHTLMGVDDLLNKAKEANVLLYVGYQLRFHPAIQEIKRLIESGKIGTIHTISAEFGQWLPDWRPNADYQCTYTAHKSMGGGILLDASHELDYVQFLVSAPVSKVCCFINKLSELDTDAEENADIVLQFENGTNASVHLDYLNKVYTREVEMIGSKTSVRCNVDRQSELYVQELKHFIRCIEGKEKPMVDGYSAKCTLEVALACRESAETGNIIRFRGANG